MPLSSTFTASHQTIVLIEPASRAVVQSSSLTKKTKRDLPYSGRLSGCVHEVKGRILAEAIAFSAVLSAQLARREGHILYIATDRCLHPLGLLPYGVNLSRLVVITAKRQQDLIWAVTEGLRCSQVSAVMALLHGIDLTTSRRLQLAAEESGATGFLLGHMASPPIASSVTRWKISKVVNSSHRGFEQSSWLVELSYCRGGHPGSWILEWRDHEFRTIATQPAMLHCNEARTG